MKRLLETSPVPARTLWIVRSWETEGCYISPGRLLNETLTEHGRGAYLFLLAEMFRVLRKKFGTRPEKRIHIVVKPGYWFQVYPGTPAGDSIQMEGNATIHTLPKEAQ